MTLNERIAEALKEAMKNKDEARKRTIRAIKSQILLMQTDGSGQEILPAQLSESELEEILKNIIAEVGAEGPKDMGKVMGEATKRLVGKADGKLISVKVKSLLG